MQGWEFIFGPQKRTGARRLRRFIVPERTNRSFRPDRPHIEAA
jgi:hypothetical protein